jgi:hypothetical protein
MDETKVNEPRPRRRLPAVAWVAIGVLGAAIIAPASAYAASNWVGIVSANGHRVAVTPAGQLEETQTNPGNFVSLYLNSGGECENVYTVPKNRALIIESVTFNTLDLYGSAGDGIFSGLYARPDCAGDYFLDENPAGTGETSMPLTPGVTLKSGTALSFENNGNDTEVYVFGYLVPSSEVGSSHIPASSVRAAAIQGRR